MNMNEQMKESEENILHTYNRFPVVFEKGQGCYLYDSEGKEYLDFAAGIAVNSLGYHYPGYDEALKDQIDKLMHISNLYYNEPIIEAGAKLVKASKMSKAFFTNSGTEAIEGALKAAKKYAYVRDGHADHEIIAMNHSFHGRSIGALSVTGTAHYREPFEPLMGGVKFADFNDLESVKAQITDKTCAIITETVQGEGGIYPATKEFLEGLRKLCDEKDIILILDEIQDCPEARTALKFFRIDGRYDVIGTGSLLGVKGYGKEPRSVPVGSETVLEMYPLDFQEFLWANDITEPVIALLQSSLDSGSPVPEALHNRMRQLLLQYTVVGGMPDAVQTFVTSRQMDEVLRIQRDIVRSYEDDMVKYAEKKDKSRIKECFQSIPRQLAKENKKFQYSVVKKGSTSAKYAGSLQWIEDAGIITRCHNLSITELPLDGNAEEDTFKVYMCDTGLFVSMLEDGTQFDILQGDLYGYKGAIFENLIADIFTKMGRKLYYFHKDSGLEVDFVIRYQGECTLVEVKARSGNVKSTKTILNHPEKYHVSHAIKLGDYNIGKNGPLLTLPLYMAFLLRSC